MVNSKLINILQTFTSKEIRKFDDYISSQYFNKNSEAINLYRFSVEDYPRFRDIKIDRKDAFKFVFPGLGFDEQKLRYVMTDLVKLLEDFLSLIQHEKKPLSHKLNLLKELSDRKLKKYFQNTADLAISLRSKNEYRDAKFFYEQFTLESELYNFQVRNFQRSNDESLKKSVENLDLFYLATKLRSCCELMNRKNVFADTYKILFLDEILLHLKNNSYDDYPAISIYYQILMTLVESEKEEHFTKLKNLLDANAEKFSMDEARDMYAFAQNYCIKKINSGNSSGYQNELFVMYKTLIKKEIIFLDNCLSPWHFKNIVIVALRVEEYDWTEKFIYEYKNKISPEYRENAFTYNLASLRFHKKEYSKAVKLLQNVDYTDIYYHLDSKSLLLKTYYELDEIESLLSLIDAFRIFLRRNKLISDYQRTVYLNLVKFVKKAMNIKLKSKSPEKINQLKKEIESTKQVADIKWLMRKIEEMEANAEKSIQVS